VLFDAKFAFSKKKIFYQNAEERLAQLKENPLM